MYVSNVKKPQTMKMNRHNQEKTPQILKKFQISSPLQSVSLIANKLHLNMNVLQSKPFFLSNLYLIEHLIILTSRINNHGVVKTFVVRYKCCYGYKRTENSPGCTKKIDLLPLLSAIDDVGGKEFRNLIRATDLEDRFNNENLTVFVPTDMALTEFSEKMTELVSYINEIKVPTINN